MIQPYRRLRSLLESLALHTVLLVMLGFMLWKRPNPIMEPASSMLVEITRSAGRNSSQETNLRHARPPAKAEPGKSQIYVPQWAKSLDSPRADGALGSPQAFEGNDGGAQTSKDLLFTESKAWAAFDNLAGRINGHLDYPDLMVENGIQGGAQLDLFFDSNGDVDENRSKTFGDNRYIRGMFVRAARKGLVEWLASDALRLRKEQFRNQHFRADFVLAYSQMDLAELTKTAPGSYNFLRRKVSNITCLGEIGGAPVLNLACIAIAVGGVIHRSVSDKYKQQVDSMKETLETYDQMGLDGINALARDAS